MPADVKSNTNRATAAFEAYCRDPVVAEALAQAAGSITAALLMDAFMRGAAWAAAEFKKGGA